MLWPVQNSWLQVIFNGNRQHEATNGRPTLVAVWWAWCATDQNWPFPLPFSLPTIPYSKKFPELFNPDLFIYQDTDITMSRNTSLYVAACVHVQPALHIHSDSSLWCSSPSIQKEMKKITTRVFLFLAFYPGHYSLRLTHSKCVGACFVIVAHTDYPFRPVSSGIKYLQFRPITSFYPLFLTPWGSCRKHTYVKILV